ncbi:MAG: ABC transporter permease [Treponema sp.]|jgi:ribose/xylose/arabinose/galactoside ABC-type transport system permease subunit|nr:ABC transporter permease [Treponema sp.]
MEWMMKIRLKLNESNMPILILILLIVGIFFGFTANHFFTRDNILNILRQVSVTTIVALAATLVMITRALDISVGGTLAFAGVVYATLATKGIPLPVCFLITITASALVGLINAGLVVGLKVNPVIATLGTMYSTRGLAFLYSGGTSVSNGLPVNFNVLGRGYIGFMPIPVLFMLITAVLFWFLLNKTLLGKYTYAIGGNPVTAVLSGIPTAKIMGVLFVLVGAAAGASGALMASRLGSGQPNVGNGFEFDVILAILLGGTSLAGGEGTIEGTLVASIIVGVLSNGLNMMGVHTFYQYIIKGLVLVLAVVIDQQMKRSRSAVKITTK